MRSDHPATTAGDVDADPNRVYVLEHAPDGPASIAPIGVFATWADLSDYVSDATAEGADPERFRWSEQTIRGETEKTDA